MSEYRAKPSGLGWVVQEKLFGFVWRTIHRVYCDEIEEPVWFGTLAEARRDVDLRRERDAKRAEESRKIEQHERGKVVKL